MTKTQIPKQGDFASIWIFDYYVRINNVLNICYLDFGFDPKTELTVIVHDVQFTGIIK